ncbi:MAG: general secretion pathway protein GspD [Pseudomonas sp.]|nr:general secretion pathway protein GspD [Pseudomonas sp.]|tara:strand:- start:11910 stop:14153 length:2244 start_codon:yes stop_codon:yes gene_type:complete
MTDNAHGQLRCRLSRSPLSLLTLAMMLTGCAIDPSPTPLPEPIRPPQQQEAYDANLQQGSVRDEQTLKAQRFQTTPGRVRSGPTYVEASADALGQDLTGPAISLNLNNFPLPAFINEVFGNRLGLSFSIAPALQSKSDLVSLRLNEPQPPADIFATARFVLNDYGVAIAEREGVLYFQVADNTANDSLPLLVSGSALPDVPMSHRPVFQQIPMRVVRADSMVSWLNEMFAGSSLQVSSDAITNSVLLRGPIDLIRQASQAIEVFDKPALKGSHSMAISPVYSDADALGNALISVLRAEGYDVSESPPLGGVTVLRLKDLQRLIIFAADPEVLNTARHWVELLDRQSQEQVESGLFVYQVRNTQAAGIATMLGALGYSASIPDTGLNNSNTSSATGNSASSLTGSSGFGSTSGSRGANNSVSSGPTTIQGNPEQGNVVVDANRNAIIYKGSGQQWLQLRPLLEELDRPVPSVMIDVLLAEVNINDREGLGIDWRNITASIGATDLILGTANGIGASGLNISALNSAGQTKAALNAFYENKQAVIRSSPKLMVRSGEEAHIEVGNEIPVVTGTTQSTDTTNAPITQTVQYRKTGVLLSIKPTVQASGVVDLQVSQELSESTDTGTGASLTPIINNRKVETTLTLRDGGSVMLAGLISSNKGRGDTGVPLLGDIPWVGNLFKSQSASENRTELIVMIIPYIIRDFDEAQNLTRSYQQRLPMNSAPNLDRRGFNQLPEANPNPPTIPTPPL